MLFREPRFRAACLAMFAWVIADVSFQVAPAERIEGGRNQYGLFRLTPPERFIPLTRPEYISPKKAPVPDDQLVIGVEVGNDVRCFPIRQMAYHHAVNDEIGGEKLAITYCIMANTAVIYRLDDVDKGLWAAGLFGGVLVLGRIGSDEIWPQIASVPLPDNPSSRPLVLGPRCVIAPFGRWKAVYPKTKVLAPDKEFELYYEAYDRKPKGYNANPLMNETVVHRDRRLGPGEEVLGVTANGKAKAYPLTWLKTKGRVEDTIGGQKAIVIWDGRLDTARVEEPFAGLWMRSYWYAWSSFYQDTAIAGKTTGQTAGP